MTYAKNDADWSAKVKEKYHGICAFPTCTRTFGLGAHHIFRRGHKKLRLVIENGVYVCSYHHRMFERKGVAWREQIVPLLIGKQTYLELKEVLQTISPLTNTESTKRK